MDAANELVDVLDDAGRVIGVVTRREMRQLSCKHRWQTVSWYSSTESDAPYNGRYCPLCGKEEEFKKGFLAVLERLRAEHPEVRRWWQDQEVGPKTVAAKVLRHPVHGRMAVEEVMLRPAVAPELQLVINLPVSPP